MKQIIKITSAKGPKECAWVVSKLRIEFEKFLLRHQIEFDTLDVKQERDSGLVQSIYYQVAKSVLVQEWVGTHLWIGQSPFRKNHKRKNWFVAIQTFEVNSLITFDPNSIKVDTMRSGGAGGQHVNKTESGVRVTHIDSGVSVIMTKARSQHKNKKDALVLLEAKLIEYNQEQINSSQKEMWAKSLQIERGNPIKTFYGTKFKLK